MRDSSDVTFIVSAFLAAYNAKAFGVRDYIAQLMFNSPPGLSDAMDLAKMLAALELIQPLAYENFHIYRQTRTGLLSYPLSDPAARSHLSTSIYLQMGLKPDIIHIVGHTEAHHAATGTDIINASGMAQRAIESAMKGAPDMAADPKIQTRTHHLVAEAKITLAAIQSLAKEPDLDAFTDPATLSLAVSSGILDAPQLRNNQFARGKVRTQIINGACDTVDEKGKPLSESQRLSQLDKKE